MANYIYCPVACHDNHPKATERTKHYKRYNSSLQHSVQQLKPNKNSKNDTDNWQNVGDLITRAILARWLASTEGKSHLEDRETERGGQIRSVLVSKGLILPFFLNLTCNNNAIFVVLWWLQMQHDYKCKKLVLFYLSNDIQHLNSSFHGSLINQFLLSPSPCLSTWLTC